MQGTQAQVYTGSKAQEHLAYAATDIYKTTKKY